MKSHLSKLLFVLTLFLLFTIITTLSQTATAQTIADAVDNTSLTFTTGGDADWFAETTNFYFDGDAAQSGAISDSQSSWMETSVTGPALVSFYWMVSSEWGSDFLKFYIDGNEQAGGISGGGQWTQMMYAVPSGTHTVRWEYSKDAIGSCGDCFDAAWVDKVEVCYGSYSISPINDSFSFSGGSKSIDVIWASGDTCSWIATPNDSWISIDSVTPGAPGNVEYTVGGYPDVKPSRTGTITIAGNTFTIAQSGLNIIDTSFNAPDGFIFFNITGNPSNTITSVAIQSDGKIVVAGYTDNGSDYDVLLLRYNSDGSLDTSFNSPNGFVTFDGPAHSDDGANSIAIQSDGKIIVTGHTYSGSYYDDVLLLRYNSNGSLDTTSFNSPDGFVTFDGPAHGYDDANSVAIQPDGRIVIAGYTYNGSNYDVLLLRYNSDGSLDTTFNPPDGFVTFDSPVHSDDGANSIAIQPDGKILVAGSTDNGSDYDVLLLRYNSDGSLDTTFNSPDGFVTFDSPVHSDDGANSIAIQPDGKILVAGYSYNVENEDILLLRYNSNGSLDTSFNSPDGFVTFNGPALSNDYASSVAIQPDGKIIIAGSTFNANSDNDDLLILRFNNNGSLDNTFGAGGFATFSSPFNSYSYSPALALQQDKKIVVAADNSYDKVLVVRLLGGGLVSWKDPVDGNWSDGTKWDKGIAPGASDYVYITVPNTVPYQVSLDTSATVNSLTIGDTSSSQLTQFLYSYLHTLTLNDSSRINVTGQITIDSSIINGSNTLTVDGVLYLLGSNTVNPPVDLAGQLVINGSSNFLNSAITTQSTSRIAVTAVTTGINAELTFANGFTNNGLIELGSNVSGSTTSLYITTGLLENSDTGTITGDGTVEAAITNAGTINPGSSEGMLTISGDISQTASGIINIELGGTIQGTQYDYLAVSNSAVLTGTLNVTLINGFDPPAGSSYAIMTYGSKSGTFATINLPVLSSGKTWNVDYGTNSLTLSVLSPCTYTIAPADDTYTSSGGTGTVGITADSTCTWTASSNDSWITVTAGSSGTGTGTVSYSVDANTGAARTGTITAAGQTFTVSQASGCTYTIAPADDTYTSSGGTGTVGVTTDSTCTWTASSNDSWITVTSGSSGTGTGTVGYSVDANTGAARTGTITAAGQTFTVSQSEATYTVDITTTGNGTVRSVPSGPYAYDTKVVFYIKPAKGYRVSEVKMDGISIGAVKTVTFRQMTSNHTLAVTFKKGKR